MSPRRPAVNEAMRARSRTRIMQAAAELIAERGYEQTTLGDIARQAGVARGLVSYYFPSKRYLLQSSMHRLMHLTLAAALRELPPQSPPDRRLARTIDAILGIAVVRTDLMRTHLALILAPNAEGFIQDPEQRRLGALLQEVLRQRGAADPVAAHAELRSALMGGCMGLLLPNAQAPLEPIRAGLYARYGLEELLGGGAYLPPIVTAEEPEPPAEVARPSGEAVDEGGADAGANGGAAPGAEGGADGGAARGAAGAGSAAAGRTAGTAGAGTEAAGTAGAAGG